MLLRHIKENMINNKDLTYDEIIKNFNMSEEIYWCFDTETCMHHRHIEEYENILKLGNEDIKNTFINNAEFKVYAWGLSNTLNDVVIYGETIKEFFETIERISEVLINFHNPKERLLSKYLNFNIFVHNLKYDQSYLNYYLFDNNFKYTTAKIMNNKRVREKSKEFSFEVTEANNTVYGSTISIPSSKKNKNINLKFHDSFKILARSLSDIGKEAIHINEMFLKKDNYDYDGIRPEGHNLTLFEMEYLYCDVYILKEFLKQFWITTLKTRDKTAASIAFNFFISNKFKLGGKNVNFKAYKEHYPTTKSLFIKAIEKKSYLGGYTHPNPKYLNKIFKGKGCSIDINSSYPAVLEQKLLPFGYPLYVDHEDDFYFDGEYPIGIILIEFDGFKNIDPKDTIGKIQCGAVNSKIFHCSGTSYLSSNFIGDKPMGSNTHTAVVETSHRFQLAIWNFELEERLKHMDFYIQDYEINKYTDNPVPVGDLHKGFKIRGIVKYQADKGFFAEEVNKCMEMKNNGKKLKNASLKQSGKLLANSFYGKNASRIERESREMYIDEHGITAMRSIGKDYNDEKEYYVPLASAVTAWGRVNLLTSMYKIGVENVLYFDTDSLYTTLEADEVIQRLGIYGEYDKEGNLTKIIDPEGLIDEYVLGKWKIEKEYKLFKAIAPKKYMMFATEYGKNDYDLKCACAGLPKDVRQDRFKCNFNTFKLGEVFTGKKTQRNGPGGIRITQGDYRLIDNNW